jgi:putative oxidoreductase
MILPLLVFGDWALLVLRLMVAGVFLAHGWPKLRDLKTNAENFGMMGFRPGWFWGTIVALVENLGGALLMLGIGTQAVGVLMAGQILVAAIWKKRQGMGLVNGYELDLLLAAAALVLATNGGGALALWF